MKPRKSNLVSALLRIPSPLKASLENSASADGVSFNRYCVRVLERISASDGAPLTSIGAGLSQMINSLQVRYKSDLVGIVIYGSYARGEATPSSDVDVLVVLTSDVVMDRDLYDDLPKLTLDGLPVSFTIVKFAPKNAEISSLWFEIALDGAVVFDPKLELTRRLGQIRRILLSGGARRVSSYGIAYWERGRA